MTQALDETATGYYGPYGGRYVPETLVPALEELERGWREIKEDAAFWNELAELHRSYIGRPTPITTADRVVPGKRLYLKREDLCHTGSQDQQRRRAGADRAAPG
jgi:tryptophan synthase beta chain